MMDNPHEELILKEYKHSLAQLQSIWDEIGIDEEGRGIRVNHVSKQMKNLLSDMVDEEKKFKKKILTDIEKYGQQFYTLNKDLEAGISDPADGLTLLELEQYLREKTKSLVIEAKKRNSHLRELQNQEQELCERLIEEPTDIPSRTVASKEDIKDLERKIRTLEQEKVNREKTFYFLQNEIQVLMEQLELRANTSFERDLLSDVELFTLSQQNLQKMKEMKEEYKVKVNENEGKCKNLKDQIRLLWNRLEVEQHEREDFLSTAVGHTPSTLVKLREELERLKVKQQQDMARFINKLRREIEEWWEKCYIGDSQRSNFTPYFSDIYSEEVLQAHDEEVQRLTTYHEDCKTIFAKIEHRKGIWLKFIDLEERANDPNRFGNRGCSLLKEEKERKWVKKELPLIENELENLVLAWETQQGKPFLISGLPVSEFIENEWLQYYDKKEQEKRKKQNMRINQLNYESRMGSKPPAVKRRMAGNDTLRKSKLQRIGEANPLQTSSSGNSKQPTKRIPLKERNENISTIRDGSEPLNSETTTYSCFEEGIQYRSERENIRSSTVHGISKTAGSSTVPGISRTPGSSTVHGISKTPGSSTVHGISKTPGLLVKPSPRRPPTGLPKTPRTVPRPPSRCSPRLNRTRSARRSSRNTTSSTTVTFSPSTTGRLGNITARLNFSPASSPLFKSPRSGSSRSITPSKWNKRTFLI